MINQKYNLMEENQKRKLLNKFVFNMILIVVESGAMEYSKSQFFFSNLLKQEKNKDYPFANTEYEYAWCMFLKCYFQEQENLNDLEMFVSRLNTTEKFEKLKKILHEHKTNIEIPKCFSERANLCLGAYRD